MKVALFVHNFPPEFRGGTEQVVLALAKSLQALGDEVLVVSGSEAFQEGGGQREEHCEGVELLRLIRDPREHYGLDLTHKITGSRITDLLLDRKPDVVHVHHWWTLGWDIIRRAAALGIPGGATLHDLWTACPRFFRKPPKGVRCPQGDGREECEACVRHDQDWMSSEEAREHLTFRDQEIGRELMTASFLAAPSQATARQFESHMQLGRKPTVIPHGLLNLVTARRVPREASEPLRVGTFGNLVPEKGIDLLLDAVAELGTDVELRLSGNAPDEAYLERLKGRAKDLGVPLIYTGAYGPLDPHPAQHLDLAVFPSLCQESYGLVVDEALAHGVPVVVSNRGALPERARRGGLVVSSGGAGPLRVKLASLLRSSKKLRELEAQIPDRFPSIDDAARLYQELYAAEVLEK